MKPRTCITQTLWAGLILTVLLVVSGSLSLVLHLVRDPMAVAMQAIALLVAVCWVIDFVALVILLAWAELDRGQGSSSDGAVDEAK
ncbi:MAG TPA: hypothetical protein EYP14_06485 [Planctomycetaceae bacterium]|nr:hypothetical protein [Planctomycetaceae bacterium]